MTHVNNPFLYLSSTSLRDKPTSSRETRRRRKQSAVYIQLRVFFFLLPPAGMKILHHRRRKVNSRHVARGFTSTVASTNAWFHFPSLGWRASRTSGHFALRLNTTSRWCATELAIWNYTRDGALDKSECNCTFASLMFPYHTIRRELQTQPRNSAAHHEPPQAISEQQRLVKAAGGDLNYYYHSLIISNEPDTCRRNTFDAYASSRYITMNTFAGFVARSASRKCRDNSEPDYVRRIVRLLPRGVVYTCH